MLDVNFRAEGEILSILGGEGSGRTQLLSCLAGLRAPDEGSIVLNGRPLYDSLQKICLSPSRRKAGILLENYALFPEMTVEENIRLVLRETESHSEREGGRKEGRKERRLLVTTKTAELLKEYGLDGLGGCYPDELSRAQQLMAAMARMMAAEPELVLLDNPFAGLDPYLRAEFLQKIREKLAPEKGVTCVFATADRDEAYAMGGSIASLENGVCAGEKKRDLFFREPSTVGAALLSGCRNIAEAQRLDDFHALVPAWGAVFVFAGKKFESDIDMSLSNSSIGVDAPAATFGKTACADFASVRYKFGSDIDMSLPNSSIGAGAFGKTACADFASARDKKIPRAGEVIPPREANGWEKLPEDLAFVGIREEDFCRRIPDGKKAADFRRFRVFVQRVEEDPQNWKIWFATGREARRLELSGKSPEPDGTFAERTVGTDAEQGTAPGTPGEKDKKEEKSSDKRDAGNGEETAKPAKKLLLWKVSKRELSREEIRGIRRLYVENRQIMLLTASKRG